MLSKSLAFLSLGLLSLAAPQYGAPANNNPSTTTTTSSAPAAASNGPPVHTVQVGATGLSFNPNFVNAAIGDIVMFEFHGPNHTVTQSTFAAPCTHLEPGLDSGFVVVDSSVTNFPTWSLVVSTLDPLWFFCRQTSPAAHCPLGMAFGINPPTTGNTIQAFLAAAMGAQDTFTDTATAAFTGSGIAAEFSAGPILTPTSSSAAAGTTSSAPPTTTKPGAASTVKVAGLSGMMLTIVSVFMMSM